MKRILAALLCVVALVMLFPATALASYSTTSNRGVELEYPAERDFYVTSFQATVKYFDGGDGIYYMPKPESGHGHLGTIVSGKKVTILAEKNGYFFFMASNGRCGWNGMNWFDYDKDDLKGKCGGSSDPLDYLDVSTKGARLVFPKSKYYFDEPFTMKVKASHKEGSIYLMPMPESGHGNLGTVKNGEKVTILAEKSGYYFFQTEDGRYGWNGKNWFK